MCQLSNTAWIFVYLFRLPVRSISVSLFRLSPSARKYSARLRLSALEGVQYPYATVKVFTKK